MLSTLLVHGHQHLLGLGPIEWLLNELIDKVFGVDPSSVSTYDPKTSHNGLFSILLNVPSGDNDTSNNPVFQIYNGLAPVGLALAAVGLVTRLLKMLADQRTMSTQIIADLSMRAGAAYLLIDGPGPNGVPFGGYLISWVANAGLALATAIAGEIQSSVGGVNFATGSASTLLLGSGKVLLNGAASKISGILLLLVLIPELLLLFYVIVLWLARYILLLFAAATAPLCWAVGVFDMKNRFVEWWIDCFVGAVSIPLVLLPGVALVLSLVDSGGILANIAVSPIIAIGGLWMIGKSVHRLTWKHFSHGGPVGALTAGIGAAMFIPNLALDMQASAMAAGMNGGRGFLDAKGPLGRMFNRAAELGALKGGAPFTIGPMYAAQRHMRGIDAAMGQGKDAAQIQGSFFNRLDDNQKEVALKHWGSANAFEGAVHSFLQGNLNELEWERFEPKVLLAAALNSTSAAGAASATPIGTGGNGGGPSGPGSRSPAPTIVFNSGGGLDDGASGRAPGEGLTVPTAAPDAYEP